MIKIAASALATGRRVPLLNLKAQYNTIKDEVLAAIDETCSSQRFILGPAVTEFECQIAQYCRARFAIGVSSGTDALLVALMALDVGVGDEVITTPYTFFATAGCVARLGARPLFCDIEADSYNLSPEVVEKFIELNCELRDGKLTNARTGGHVKALMPVHLFGQMSEMETLLGIAQRYHLKVVEDAAQAIGSLESAGHRAGTLGDIGCFSFFPSKNLGAFGDAGMCVTNDEVLAERLRVMRVHGGKPKYHHAVIGGNFRLDEIQAAVLCIKLKYLDGWTLGRRQNAEFYNRNLEEAGLLEHVTRPSVRHGYQHIYNQYVLRVRDRDDLRKFLSDAQVGTEIYYPIPLHIQECFGYLGGRLGDCPQAESAAKEIIALPIYPELTEEDMRYVVDLMGKFYG